MNTITLNITKEMIEDDIDSTWEDEYERQRTCIITKALENIGYKNSSVTACRIVTVKNKKVFFSRNDRRLREFIMDIDAKKNKKPNTFTIELI